MRYVMAQYTCKIIKQLLGKAESDVKNWTDLGEDKTKHEG